MLFIEIASRFAAGPWLPKLRMFGAPNGAAARAGNDDRGRDRPEYRLSSPNLDLATYVLIVVGALYLAEWVEQGVQLIPAVTAVALFAAASATRPLYWITTGMALGVIALGSRRELAGLGAARALILVGLLPAAVLAGSLARQAILSGYPFFPSTIVSLPVDWRMPASGDPQHRTVSPRLGRAGPAELLRRLGGTSNGWRIGPGRRRRTSTPWRPWLC